MILSAAGIRRPLVNGKKRAAIDIEQNVLGAVAVVNIEIEYNMTGLARVDEAGHNSRDPCSCTCFERFT